MTIMTISDILLSGDRTVLNKKFGEKPYHCEILKCKRRTMKIKGREDGQVLVFLALSMVVLLAIAGLAIDGGIAYGVKAKLSSAMDAAALAGANATGDSSGGYAAAIAAGKARFNANYPAGYLNSTITSGSDNKCLGQHPQDWADTGHCNRKRSGADIFHSGLGSQSGEREFHGAGSQKGSLTSSLSSTPQAR